MKKAIIFGFDYKGTQNELPDCELDANRIADAATSAGFLVQKMYQSTVVNFRAIVESLKTSPADETIIYYSGHGTQYPVVNDASEPDGREEALCFWNGHGIELCTDNAFKSLVESIPGKVTVILDSCFSGGMDRLALPPGFIRRAIEVIPPSEFRTLSKAEKAANNETVYLFAAQENQFSNSTGDGGAFTLQLLLALDQSIFTAGGIIQLAQDNVKYQTAKLVGDPNRIVLKKEAVVPVFMPMVNLQHIFSSENDLKSVPERLVVRIGQLVGAKTNSKLTAAQNVHLTFNAIWPR